MIDPAGRSNQEAYQTCRVWGSFGCTYPKKVQLWTTMDFAPWHAHVTGHMIQARQGTRSPETEVVVTVGRSIVVAVSGTLIRRLIVERRPTQHTTSGSLPD
jgi:hypothetical protein